MHDFLKALPKCEHHMHIEGTSLFFESIQRENFVLAKRHATDWVPVLIRINSPLPSLFPSLHTHTHTPYMVIWTCFFHPRPTRTRTSLVILHTQDTKKRGFFDSNILTGNKPQ